MDDAESRPPLPRLTLPSILRRRDELDRALIQGGLHPGDPLEGSKLEEFHHYLSEALSGLAIPPEALLRTCEPLAGRVLDAALVRDFAWRVAGNVHRLKDGIPAYPWTSQREPEWAPIEVLVGREMASKRGGKVRFGCEFTARVLAGSACPLSVNFWWSEGRCRLIAATAGFSKPWGRLPYDHPHQLVRLRFYALLTPEASGHRPGFSEVRCPGSMVQHNKAHIRVRCRVEPCPRGFDHPCHLCAVGYARRARGPCPHATHPITYEAAPCPGCGSEAAPFDPAFPSPRCVDCVRRDRLRPEE